MKINKIQLMQVLRNKRFLLFTVFVPVCWYAFFFNVQEDAVPSVVLGIAVFIGIIGNSLATFSKRVSANIDFYRFESSFTHYSLSRWLVAQSFVQLVLNALIFAVVFCVRDSVFQVSGFRRCCAVCSSYADGSLVQFYRFCSRGSR